MMPFDYASPKTLEEAVGLLGDSWGETEILAGGADLVTSMKQRLASPKRVVSLKNLPELKTIKADGDGLRVGAMATLRDLAAHAVAREQYPSLITAIREIASPQMISIGTVGGDLCQRPRCWFYRSGMGLFATHNGQSLVENGDNRYHAIFGNEGPACFVSPSSLGPPLIALGAEVIVTGSGGKSRTIAMKDFFRTPQTEDERETALAPNEILTAIHIPSSGLTNATYEVRHRAGLDWPYATAAVAFKLQGGAASQARVVLGHVAPVPWPVPEAAKVLEGAVNEALAVACGEAAARGAKPLSRNGYKVTLVKTAVKRAVLAAAGIEMEGAA